MSDDIVAKNKVVYMTYTVIGPDGRVMGQQDLPVGYVHGAGSGLFEEIEAALEGHRVGERVSARLTSDKAFGSHDPGLVIVEELENVPPSIRHLGAEADLQNDRGDVLSFRVVAIADGKITLDGNNPLAGKDATCMVEIVSVRDATPGEISSGFPEEQGVPKLH